MNIIVWICRILVGVLFIISGLIKANDPVGFSIKLDEYFTVFNTPWFTSISLGLAIFICIIEVLCGIAAIIGFKPKQNAWILILMIVFFTFLTFYSAYFNKVTDCGCFGDAIKFTPWQSFSKDIILLILIIPIFLFRNKVKELFSSKINSVLAILGTVFVTWFSLHCYNHLPYKDFRPYAIGNNIEKQMAIPLGAPVDKYETMLVYKNLKTNEKKEFTQDQYMQQKIWEDTLTWAWDTTMSKLVTKGYKAPIHDFKVSSFLNDSDITNQIITNPNYQLLIISYNINKSSTANLVQLNTLVNALDKKSIKTIGITASDRLTTDNYRHENQLMFDFNFCDETQLKTMIRSNPGIVLLKKGTVINMWHHNDIPSVADFTKKYL